MIGAFLSVILSVGHAAVCVVQAKTIPVIHQHLFVLTLC